MRSAASLSTPARGCGRASKRPASPLKHPVTGAAAPTGTWAGPATRESQPTTEAATRTTPVQPASAMHGFASRSTPPMTSDWPTTGGLAPCVPPAHSEGLAPGGDAGGGGGEGGRTRLYPGPTAGGGRRACEGRPPHTPSHSGRPARLSPIAERSGRGGGGLCGWRRTKRPGDRVLATTSRRLPWHTPTDRLRGATPPCRARAARRPVASVASTATPSVPPAPPLSHARLFLLLLPPPPRSAVAGGFEPAPSVVARGRPVSGRPARLGDPLPPAAAAGRPVREGGQRGLAPGGQRADSSAPPSVGLRDCERCWGRGVCRVGLGDVSGVSVVASSQTATRGWLGATTGRRQG